MDPRRRIPRTDVLLASAPADVQVGTGVAPTTLAVGASRMMVLKA